ncbi:molybdate ABC transporter substrate-binding protein [uncultured Friedmanniella sp.]|uniref:molybdate ABC transporter substrate-binding protein n=1 Tax=uncultured Friedmanniella sp. TaxID=335381 RepID=UPI0035CC2382
MNRPLAALATTALVAALAGCGSDATPAAGSSGSAASSTTLTVYAAASLKSTFTTLGGQFETAHPGTTVTFNFAGSADLVTQLQQGAPADVFASADTNNMTKAADLVTGSPVNFATNTLEIAVPPDNPAHITSFSDLTKSGVKLVVCAPAVPCGAAAQKIETATKVTLKPVSEENAVTDVLTKVETGEADAGLVYVTDVKGAGGKVLGVTFPESQQAVNTYPIAALKASKNADLAKEFTELVTGAAGQKVLADAGFAKP